MSAIISINILTIPALLSIIVIPPFVVHEGLFSIICCQCWFSFLLFYLFIGLDIPQVIGNYIFKKGNVSRVMLFYISGVLFYSTHN